MFSLARQAVAPRLAQPAAWTIRHLSSKSEHGDWVDSGIERRRARRLARMAAEVERDGSDWTDPDFYDQLLAKQARPGSLTPAHTSKWKEWVDPGVEQRRIARLAREAARRAPAPRPSNRPSGSSGGDEATTSIATATWSGQHGHPRKPSRRDHMESSEPRRGTERSRTQASSGAVDAIVNISRNATAMVRKPARTRSFGPPEEIELEHPQFTGPEPVPMDMSTILDTVPNLVSALPPLPSPQYLQQLGKLHPRLVSQAFGGDYSQYQLKTSAYLKGAQGPASTYANIILQHNRSVPLESRNELVNAVQALAT